MLRGKVEGEDPSSRRSRKLLVRRGGRGDRSPGDPPAAFATFRRAKSRPVPTQATWKKRETRRSPSDTSGFCYFSPREKEVRPHSSNMEEERAGGHPPTSGGFCYFIAARKVGPPPLKQLGRRERAGGHPPTSGGFCYFIAARKADPPQPATPYAKSKKSTQNIMKGRKPS